MARKQFDLELMTPEMTAEYLNLTHNFVIVQLEEVDKKSGIDRVMNRI
jgi:hypothetical protein